MIMAVVGYKTWNEAPGTCTGEFHIFRVFAFRG